MIAVAGSKWMSLKRREWSESEDQVLRRLAPKTSVAEAAITLGRSHASVLMRARKLQVTWRNSWPRYTEADLQRMRRLAEQHTTREVAAILGRTPEGLRNRAADEGLRFKKGQVARVGPAGKGPGNRHARPYSLRSPEGEHYSGRNILHFIRQHASLFDQRDLQWKNGNCHAGRKLRQLRPGRKYSLRTWKGWSWWRPNSPN